MASSSDAGNQQRKKPTVAELPNTTIARVIKKALPEGTLLAKDARVAFTRAASTWVLYLTNAANEFAKASQKNRKTPTITAHDVLAAVEELEFKEFLEPLQSFLSEYQEGGKKAKKPKEKRKSAPEPSSSSSADAATTGAKKKQKTGAAASSSSSSSSSSKPSSSDENKEATSDAAKKSSSSSSSADAPKPSSDSAAATEESASKEKTSESSDKMDESS